MRRFALFAIFLALFFAPGATHATSQLAIPSGWPKALAIARIGVHAAIDADPLTQIKPIEQQPPWADVLWYSRGTKPGDPGRALIFGHLDTFTGPATFWNLHELQPGDRISFTYAHGALNFQVMWLHEYPKTAVPYSWIFGHSKQRGVVLVTCSGVFHGLNSGGYDHRILVYARLLLPTGQLA